MEYRLGTDLRIKSRGETDPLTCPSCGKKVKFGVFSNYERRYAFKFPIPLDCHTVYFLVCPSCASVFGVSEECGDSFKKGEKLSIGNFDLKQLKPFRPELKDKEK